MADRPRLVGTRHAVEEPIRGIVSDRASGARVEVNRCAPSEALDDVVAYYWSGRWDFAEGEGHTTLMLSDPSVNFVFERAGSQAGSRVVGVWTKLWERTLEGRGFVRGAKLHPGALRAFTGTAAHELSNRIVELSHVFGREIGGLERAVLEPEDDGAGFGAIEEWLSAGRRRSDQEPISLAVAIVRRITRDPEITTVQRLADVAGLSRRHLQRLFRDHVGASPKWVIRRNRLQEVAARLESGEAPNLARLAAELGYTDQAHLSHDFRNAVGRSPSAFRPAAPGD